MLFALLATASAGPISTPTSPQTATSVILGPRRNGYSDLPSDAWGYNYRQVANQIPDFVMASDPSTGGNAITYTRDEVYTAMQVCVQTWTSLALSGVQLKKPGHRFSKDMKCFKALVIPLPTQACLSTTRSKLTYALPRHRHAALLTAPSIQYPMIVDFEEVRLLDTYYGQYGEDGESPTGQDIGNVFAWPLLWTNSWTGRYSYIIASSSARR